MEEEALDALIIEYCRVVLVPHQEESESKIAEGEYDNWSIYCSLEELDNVEDELGPAQGFRLVSEDEFAEFRVSGVSLSELCVMFSILESEILRLSFDEVLDRHYFSD